MVTGEMIDIKLTNVESIEFIYLCLINRIVKSERHAELVSASLYTGKILIPM